jgi:Uncharacterized conserved protein
MLVVPMGPVRAQIIVVNSRFIASLDRASSVEEARAFVGSICAEFPDATHNVPAFIVGGGKTVTEFCSDDGEPSGTSGRPLLAVLKGSGLGDVTIVVTRYFGGTLLGTGGLVKAYSEAGKAVLALVKRAALVPQARLEFCLPYHLLERERLAAGALGATVVEESFAESVRVVLDVPKANLPEFEARLAEMSAGRVGIKQIGENVGLSPA